MYFVGEPPAIGIIVNIEGFTYLLELRYNPFNKIFYYCL